MFLDLVLVTHVKGGTKFLFQAPEYCRLEKGDMVICDTKNGEVVGEVINIEMAVYKESNTYEFIIEAAGAREPLRKIISKVEYRKFQYNDEEGEV